MAELADPALSVKTVLYDSWALTGVLAKANLTFETKQIVASRFLSHPYVIEVVPTPSEDHYQSRKRYTEWNYLDVHIWVRSKVTKGSDYGAALAYRHSIVREAKRVLRNQAFKATDVDHIELIRTTPHLDDPDPHVLHALIEVNAKQAEVVVPA